VLAAFANAFRTPDLRKKIFFTLAILAIFRLGSIIPTPNVNVKQVNFCLKQATTGDQQGLYSLINLFSGGALLQLAIFALGIMPYITASIILQLLTVVIPRLEALKKEGQSGQTKITQYTRYLTLVLAVLNSTAFVTVAVNDRLFTGCPGLVYDKSIFPVIVMILTMTAGTGVIMWLGELITERGVGNGMSVLIFTQIAATFPSALWSIKVARPGSQGWVIFLLVVGLGLLVMLGVIFVELSQRRIPGASTPSAWWGAGCSAVPPPTFRSRSTKPASSRSSLLRRCCICRLCMPNSGRMTSSHRGLAPTSSRATTRSTSSASSC
jgi:preprotein translocase subunit SecY